MANILVTGGRGFIGTNLVQELTQRGHEVWTCDILHGPSENHTRADTGAYEQLERLVAARRYDFVYHLAAEYGRWNGEDHYANVWQTNVVGTKNLLRLQQKHGFRMIFFSSAEVYGDYDGLMSEDVMERLPIKQMNDYAISKWTGELQCENHAAMFGLEIVRVRPVGCYGPHEHYNPYRGVIPIFVHQALVRKPFTVHRGHTRIFDYVEDTCRTFANIVDNFLPGQVYNVGGREEWATSIEVLAEMVLEITGAPSSLVTFAGEEGFTTRTKVVDFTKARRDLRHDPVVDLKEGLSRYVAWVRQAHGL